MHDVEKMHLYVSLAKVQNNSNERKIRAWKHARKHMVTLKYQNIGLHSFITVPVYALKLYIN